MNIKRNILLNPGPATTTDSVKLAQVVPDICPRELEFGSMQAGIQGDLVDFVGSRDKYACVLVGGSGTAAVEMAISSVIKPGSKLFVINNGAYSQRIIKMAKIYGIPVINFESSNYEAIDYAALEEAITREKNVGATNAKTGVGAGDGKSGLGAPLTHLAVVHHETTSGLLNDITHIGELCRTHKLSLIVDAMSSYAAIPVDMVKDNIDYLLASSNKNLQGMAGIGFAICNKVALEATKDYPMRNLYLNLYDQYAYFNKTSQFRFTPPVQTMYALRQAIAETKQETVPARYARYLESYKVLRAGMEALGFKVLVADKISSGLITTFFEPEDANYSFEHMHDYCYAHGFTIYPGKVSQFNTFRLANMGQINAKDIQDFLKCLDAYLKEQNIKV